MPVKPGVTSRMRSISPQDARLRARLDDPALVLGDRAEAAAAEAAAHDRHREPDHLVGRDLGAPVARVRARARRAARRAVHLGGGQRQRRRVEPDVAPAVALDQGARVARVGLEVEDARGVGVEDLVGGDLLERGQADRGARAVGAAARAELDQGRAVAAARRVAGRARRLGALGLHRVRIRRRRHRPGPVDRGRVELAEAVAPADERGAAHVADLVDRRAARPAGARSRPSRARRCRRRGGRPCCRPGPSAGPCRSSSRSGRCGAATPRCRRSPAARRRTPRGSAGRRRSPRGRAAGRRRASGE